MFKMYLFQMLSSLLQSVLRLKDTDKNLFLRFGRVYLPYCIHETRRENITLWVWNCNWQKSTHQREPVKVAVSLISAKWMSVPLQAQRTVSILSLAPPGILQGQAELKAVHDFESVHWSTLTASADQSTVLLKSSGRRNQLLFHWLLIFCLKWTDILRNIDTLHFFLDTLYFGKSYGKDLFC